MAVNVGVDAIEALEHLAKEGREGFGEWNTCNDDMFQLGGYIKGNAREVEKLIVRKEKHTDPTGKHLFVVNVALTPRHEMLNVFWCGHFGWALEVVGVLPQIFEPNCVQWCARRSREIVTKHTHL